MYGLELRIGSRRGLVTVQAYRGLLDEMRGLLTGVTPGALSNAEEITAWGVRHVPEPSNLTLRLEPMWAIVDQDGVARLTAAVVAGVRQLDQVAEIPPFYTDVAVELLGRLAGRRGRDGVESLSVAAVNGRVLDEAEVTDAVAVHVAESITPAATDYGSVEGVVDALRGGARGRRNAVVLDGATGQRVRVQFGDDHADLFRGAWGGRVAVYGRIQHNKAGQPIRVDAEDAVVLAPLAASRALRNLAGIAPGWTGGRSVGDVMRELRGRG